MLVNERTIAEAVSKLQRAGLSDLDQLPIGAVRVLAEMSEDELRVLAKAQRDLTSGGIIRPLDFGNILF
jgi:hypothetical protein